MMPRPVKVSRAKYMGKKHVLALIGAAQLSSLTQFWPIRALRRALNVTTPPFDPFLHMKLDLGPFFGALGLVEALPVYL